MKETAAKLTIVTLFAISVILGYLIYSAYSSKKTYFAPQPQSQSSSESIPTNKTDDITNIDWDNLSEEEKNNQLTKISKLAQSTNELQIAETCQTSPYVIKIKTNSKLTIINTDDIEHTFAFNGSYPVGPGKTIYIPSAKFKTGMNRYACDGIGSGYIVVE